MPRVPCTVLRQRLNPGAFQRAVLLSESFSPEAALQAGFFDALSTPAELMSLAQAKAEDLKKLDMRAHADSKRRIRSKQISTIRRQVPLDLVEAVKYGLSGRKPKKS